MIIKRKVLYVSDNKFMHIVIKDTLRPYNIKIIDAYSGEEALSSLKIDQPDLILSDIDMPGIDGYDLCKIVCQHKNYNQIPMVIYSSSENTEDIEKAYAAGAKGYIIKKYHNEILADKILKFIR